MYIEGYAMKKGKFIDKDGKKHLRRLTLREVDQKA